MRALAILLAWAILWEPCIATGQLIVIPRRGRAAAGGGSVTLDTVTSAAIHCDGGSAPCDGGTGTVPTLTFSYTVGAGSNRALAVTACVAGNSGSTQPLITGITYATVALTQKLHTIPGTNRYCDIWTMADGTQPATGSNNVVVTTATVLASGDDNMNVGVFSATGVNQSQQFRTSSPTGNSGASGNATLTLGASTSGDLVISQACHGTTLTSTTQTQKWLNNSIQLGACATTGGSTATGGTTSLGWTVSGTDTWIQIGASWQP